MTPGDDDSTGVTGDHDTRSAGETTGGTDGAGLQLVRGPLDGPPPETSTNVRLRREFKGAVAAAGELASLARRLPGQRRSAAIVDAHAPAGASTGARADARGTAGRILPGPRRHRSPRWFAFVVATALAVLTAYGVCRLLIA